MRKKGGSGRSRMGIRGATIIEMVVGLMVLLPVILLIMDVIILNIAVQVNDSAAREADRLAASGSPSEAEARARRVVERINGTASGYITKIKFESITLAPTTLIADEAALVPYGGNVEGSVSIKTRVTVTPILLRFVYPGPYDFIASQTCPITYNVPNTAGGQPVAP